MKAFCICKRSETLKQRIPQFMSASYFGVNPVTLSRIANQDDLSKKSASADALGFYLALTI
ncbi:MAG: hypothetical protein H7318_08165 [Oligoflexus sp.]|nr:hypothetical protein [Oligoflexus sp.]